MSGKWNRAIQSTAARWMAGVLGAGALLAGCASTGGLKPQAKIMQGGELAAARSLDGVQLAPGAWPQQAWWTTYKDPQLDALIDEALAASPSLQMAQARARLAQAAADASESTLAPRIDADLSQTRERFAARGLIPPPVAGTWGSVNEFQASLGWDPDLFGRNRAAFDAAVGRARASTLDSQAARLALSVDIALAYVQLQRAFEQLGVARAATSQREQIYELTRQRNAAGIDSRLELKEAEAALPAAREQMAQWQEIIAVTRNALAALLGQGPDRGLAIARPDAAAMGPVALPTNVPAELIGRRPDILAQRWRIEAARRDIASARARFYPNLNLTALIGFQSLGSSGFLSLASREFGVGPAVNLPLFDGGRRRADLGVADAQFDAEVDQYNQSLSDALRDVVDQLASWRSVEQQRHEQQQALGATRTAYDLAVLRYREGVGNYLQVLSTETEWLAQQRLKIDLDARALELSVRLVRALGGGTEASSASLAANLPLKP